jgi:hypothetical protein
MVHGKSRDGGRGAGAQIARCSAPTCRAHDVLYSSAHPQEDRPAHRKLIMFRISQYMEEIAHPTPLGPKRNPPGPVVIWNLIRRCNLTCKHCYSISADKDFPGELTTAEVFAA